MRKVFTYSSILFLILTFLTNCYKPDESSTSRSGGSDNSDNGSLSAPITIVNWTQDYYDWGEWSLVDVDYEIKNTGNQTIDFYEVWFSVTCVDDSVYTDYDVGMNVLSGTTTANYTYLDTAGKEAVSVDVYDYELTHYDW